MRSLRSSEADDNERRKEIFGDLFLGKRDCRVERKKEIRYGIPFGKFPLFERFFLSFDFFSLFERKHLFALDKQRHFTHFERNGKFVRSEDGGRLRRAFAGKAQGDQAVVRERRGGENGVFGDEKLFFFEFSFAFFFEFAFEFVEFSFAFVFEFVEILFEFVEIHFFCFDEECLVKALVFEPSILLEYKESGESARRMGDRPLGLLFYRRTYPRVSLGAQREISLVLR